MFRSLGADEVKRTVWIVPPGNWTTDEEIVRYFVRRYELARGPVVTTTEKREIRSLLQSVLEEGAKGTKVSVMGETHDLEVHRVLDERWIQGAANARLPDLESLKDEGVTFSTGFWSKRQRPSVPIFDYSHLAPL